LIKKVGASDRLMSNTFCLLSDYSSLRTALDIEWCCLIAAPPLTFSSMSLETQSGRFNAFIETTMMAEEEIELRRCERKKRVNM
jgi:hypothetical protein